MKPKDLVMIELDTFNCYGTIVSIKKDKAKVEVFDSNNDDKTYVEIEVSKLKLIRNEP